MIKTLKILAWLGLGLSAMVLVLLIIAGTYNGPDNTGMAGFRDAVCRRIFASQGHTLTADEIAWAIGRYVIPDLCIFTLLLVALANRGKGWLTAMKIIFVLMTISKIGNGGFPLLYLPIAILLFLKPVTAHFDKYPKKVADNF